MAEGLTVEAVNHVKRFGWLWLFLAACAVSGCRSFTEGDIVIRDGEAYIFTKALTKEQIAEGREIEKLWLSYYYKTNNTNKPRDK